MKLLSIITGNVSPNKSIMILIGPSPYKLLSEKKFGPDIQSDKQRLYIYDKKDGSTAGQKSIPKRMPAFDPKLARLLPETAGAERRLSHMLECAGHIVTASKDILQFARRCFLEQEVCFLNQSYI